MEKEFVPYELSLRMKAFGFDEPCIGYYKDEEFKTWNFFDQQKNSEMKTWFVSAPTFSQAFRWFEDNYKLYPAIVIDQTSYPKYAFEIASFFGNPKDLTKTDWGWNDMVLSKNLYRTKLEAEIECVKKLLELIKK